MFANVTTLLFNGSIRALQLFDLWFALSITYFALKNDSMVTFIFVFW